MKFGDGLRLFLCLLLLVFLCVSCKSTQTVVSTAVRSDSLVKAAVSARVDASASVEQIKVVRDQSVTSDDMTETVTDLFWTAPDASGLQYVIRKTVTVRSRNAKKTGDVTQNETTNSKQSQASTVSEKTQTRTNSKSDAETKKETRVTTPGFITWGALILVVAFVVFVFLFLKSKKII